MTDACWTELGIAESTDARAIRSAYARRLKAIDADRDPAAFVRLREALEDALGWAAWKLDEEEWQRSHPEEAAQSAEDTCPSEEEGMDLPFLDDDLPGAGDWFCPSPCNRSMSVFNPPVSAEPCDREEFAALQELDNILFDVDASNPPDPQELTSRTWNILDDPAMERIDHAERVEEWLARLIVDTVPHSDPVAAAAGAHFGWDRDSGRWDQRWDIQNILDRRRALHYVEQVSHPDHLLHRAWLDLTSNAPALGFERFWIGGRVRDFLDGIRERTPQVEDFLNPDRIALWDDHFGNPNRGRIFIEIAIRVALLLLGLKLLRLLYD